MLGYCEAVRCRRQVLLNYFGEERTQPCGNCDTCLEPPKTWDGTVAAQKFMSAALRTGQRFGAGHLIEILRGKATDKIKDWNHDRLPTFGVGADLDEAAWRGVARQLVAMGLLHAGEHGSLQLTAEARPVLKGETTLELRRHRPKQATVKEKRLKEGRAAPATLDAAGQSLFDVLRAWRRKLAEAQEVPPYVILHDATLHELVRLRPQTMEELGQISGIGARKQERYGEDLLELLEENG
jgi:ATP-dependent DNA helicase RecQ